MNYNSITINEKNGEFNIIGVIKVNKETTRDEIINIIGDTQLDHSVNIGVNDIVNTGLLIKSFDIRLYFKEEKLSFIKMIIHDKNDTLSWDSWDLQREVNKLQKQNDWLKALLCKKPELIRCGPYKEDTITEYNYAWGKIISRYFGQNAYSGIEISYS